MSDNTPAKLITSIKDIPRDATKEIEGVDGDRFGIKPFEQGLTKFITGTDTPITIALQGEWGSGKTSLMYSLQKSLANEENGLYEGIWLNTWEYAMMNEASDTLIEILGTLIKQILKKTDNGKTKDVLKQLWSIGKKAAVIAAKAGVNATGINGDEFVSAFLSQSDNSTIGEIRNDLQIGRASCRERV